MIGLQFTRAPTRLTGSLFLPINASTTDSVNVAIGSTGMKCGLGVIKGESQYHNSDSDGKEGVWFQIGGAATPTQHKMGGSLKSSYELVYSTLVHGKMSPDMLNFGSTACHLLDAYISGSNVVLTFRNDSGGFTFVQGAYVLWVWA